MFYLANAMQAAAAVKLKEDESLSGIEGSEKEEKGRIGPLAALFFLKKNHQWRRKKKS
jgi:hypothetical protein